MGTRALVNIHKDGKDSVLLTTLYRQFDGYPDGLGSDIKDALGSKQVVNGYSDPANQVNGMGCAAAMLVGALKDGKCGNVYIYPAGATDCGEEYVYAIYATGDKVMMDITDPDGGAAIYSGALADFDPEHLADEAA